MTLSKETPEPASLAAVQLRHTIDLLRSEIVALRRELVHTRDLAEARLVNLERARDDQETRLRAVTESTTQFRFLVTLAAGGGLLSVITLLKTLLS
jgi:hypothetical protein